MIQSYPLCSFFVEEEVVNSAAMMVMFTPTINPAITGTVTTSVKIGNSTLLSVEDVLLYSVILLLTQYHTVTLHP